jgi:uncharacterized protein YndB with AHSA1/START domain
MKLLLRTLVGIVAFGLLVLAIGLVLPADYRVERSVEIRAPIDRVFAQVADVKRWPEWGAWFERDPAMKLAYSEVTAGIGARVAWESKTEGNGEVTVKLHEPPVRMEYDLLLPDFGMASRGTFVLAPAEGGRVRVTWSDAGSVGYNPIHRWFALFMDRIVGPSFEAGLAKLKRVAEKAAAE